MKIPKYSCSTCGKPSSRKWNLDRHISNCHYGIGKCLPNWDFPDTYRPYWSRWQKMGINQENFHHIRDILDHFSSNKSDDRKPSYGDVFMKACLEELAKWAVSSSQPTQSRISFPFSPMTSMQFPMGNYNVNPAANLQIFGFRGYVCDKCLTAETHYVAFPNAKGDGRIQGSHCCHPVRAAAANELVKLIDRSAVLRSLHDKIPMLILQQIDSWTGKDNHLVALRLSSSPEKIIKLRNPADPSKPGIVFPYSEQRHLNLECAKENKDKYDYLTRAITLGREDLIDFLGHIRSSTFGVVRLHNDVSHDLTQGSASYFVYIN